MTIEKPDLPPRVYAERRQSASGTRYDFYFRPQGDVPRDWVKKYRLPIAVADRVGGKQEIKAVWRDAKKLNQQFERQLRRERVPDDTLPAMFELYQKTRAWQRLKPKTKTYYEGGMEHIRQWSAHNRHPYVGAIKWPAVLKLIQLHEGKPGLQKQIKSMLQRLFEVAVDEGIVDRSPFSGNERRRLILSEDTGYERQAISYDDVLELASICDSRGFCSMGTAVLLAFDTAQYPSMLISMTFDEHYRDGVIVTRRDKTNEMIHAPLSRRTIDRLNTNASYLLMYEGTDKRSYRKPYNRNLFAKVFRRCIKGTRFEGFEFRWLRHSAVAEGDRAGLTEQQLDAVGGWRPGGAGKATRDAFYRMSAADLAQESMRKREQYRQGR